MEIRVRFDDCDPPAGAVAGNGQEQPFAGWLGLLSVLERLLDPSPVRASAGAGPPPSPPVPPGC